MRKTNAVITKILILLLSTLFIIGCGNDDDTNPASCTDGIQNGSETDIDCGGSCSACLIFSDHFNISNTSSGNIGTSWEFPQGISTGASISIDNSKVAITQSEDNIDASIALIKNLTLTGTDHKVSSKFSFSDASLSDNVTIGLLTRIDFTEQRGYGLLYEGSQLKLFRFESDDAVEIHESTITLTENTEYILELNVSGSTFTGHVKTSAGTVIATVTGTDNTYNNGNIGFVAKSGVINETAYLDNFEVE